jgi:hypothetical protein
MKLHCIQVRKLEFVVHTEAGIWLLWTLYIRKVRVGYFLLTEILLGYKSISSPLLSTHWARPTYPEGERVLCLSSSQFLTSALQKGQKLQSALHICRFLICGFSQL